MKDMKDVQELDLLVSFSDLAGFARSAGKGFSSLEMFGIMDRYFEFVGEIVDSAGGTLVKCIGDSALMIFPSDRIDDAVMALKELQDRGDKWMADESLPCQHRLKLHFGPVVCGPFGPKDDKRFDISGETVNTAARLESHGFAMSPQVFRNLGSDTRKHFKKHTPPVTYIPVEERHRT